MDRAHYQRKGAIAPRRPTEAQQKCAVSRLVTRRSPIGRRQPEQVMRDACIEAGVPHATPHVLRHTWATEAMGAGVPDEVAARALGHSSTRELQRYQHAKSRDVEIAMAVVAKKIGGMQ